MTTVTQKDKIQRYLKTGKTLTSAEALSRFGVKNLRARISELRESGTKIDATAYTRKDGVRANKYSMTGTPTKMVAKTTAKKVTVKKAGR